LSLFFLGTSCEGENDITARAASAASGAGNAEASNADASNMKIPDGSFKPLVQTRRLAETHHGQTLSDSSGAPSNLGTWASSAMAVNVIGQRLIEIAPGTVVRVPEVAQLPRLSKPLPEWLCCDPTWKQQIDVICPSRQPLGLSPTWDHAASKRSGHFVFLIGGTPSPEVAQLLTIADDPTKLDRAIRDSDETYTTALSFSLFSPGVNCCSPGAFCVLSRDQTSGTHRAGAAALVQSGGGSGVRSDVRSLISHFKCVPVIRSHWLREIPERFSQEIKICTHPGIFTRLHTVEAQSNLWPFLGDFLGAYPSLTVKIQVSVSIEHTMIGLRPYIPASTTPCCHLTNEAYKGPKRSVKKRKASSLAPAGPNADEMIHDKSVLVAPDNEKFAQMNCSDAGKNSKVTSGSFSKPTSGGCFGVGHLLVVRSDKCSNTHASAFPRFLHFIRHLPGRVQLDISYATPKAIDAWGEALVCINPSQSCRSTSSGKLIDLSLNASPLGRNRSVAMERGLGLGPIRECALHAHNIKSNDHLDHAKSILSAVTSSQTLEVHPLS
jgi:hypothetical protein